MVESIGPENLKNNAQKKPPTHHLSDGKIANFEETFSTIQKSLFASMVNANTNVNKTSKSKKRKNDIEDIPDEFEEEEDEGYVPNLDALKRVERNIELIYYENPTLAKELQHQVRKKVKTLEELQEEIEQRTKDQQDTH
tara:strand:- start:198 stop:614 length:417 start_codon:yes stop_codon:yes gene_type:complete